MTTRTPRQSPPVPALLQGLLLSLPLLLASPVALADMKPALTAFRAGEYAKALRLTRPLAAKEDPQAMYLLGVMYEQGKGVDRDDYTAVKWYAAAARKGNYASAQYNLARMYIDGRGVGKNAAKAKEWLGAAAAQGHPESRALLAELNGGAPAVATAPAAAPAASAPAKAEIAKAPAVAAPPPPPGRIDASGPPEPVNMAAEPIARPPDAVDKHDFPERRELVVASEAAKPSEASKPAEVAKAAEPPPKPAEPPKASTPARPVEIAKAEVSAPRPAPPVAETRPEPAASTPAAPAAAATPASKPVAAPAAPAPVRAPAPDTPVLAAYRGGDYARALKLATPLAQREDGPGMYVLGKLYETGQGIKRDDYTAVKWLAAASHKANYAPAQYALARMYVDGRGVNKNMGKAREWLTTAAGQGHADSQRLLAELGGKPVQVAVVQTAPAQTGPAAAPASPPEAPAQASVQAPVQATRPSAVPAEAKAEAKMPAPQTAQASKPAETRAAEAPKPANPPGVAEAKPAEPKVAELRPDELKLPEPAQSAPAPQVAQAPKPAEPARAEATKPEPAKAADPVKAEAAPQVAMLSRPSNSSASSPFGLTVPSGSSLSSYSASFSARPAAGARKESSFNPYSASATQASITALHAAARRSESQPIEAARKQLAGPFSEVAMRYWEAEAGGDRKGVADTRAAIASNGPMAIGVAKDLRLAPTAGERATSALLTELTQSGTQAGAEVCNTYRAAAEQPGPDHAPAQYHGALCIATRDAKQSLTWLHAAADAGHAGALETLGRACIEGSEKNWGCALHYFELAAQRGRGSSMTLYGWVLSNQPAAGDKDFTEALNWYRKGAGAGDLFAQNNLGEMYERGRGTRKDDKEARQWYGRAAEAGFGPGQFNYARLLLAGTGGPKDKQGAVTWLQKAERNGIPQAKAALQQITASQ